MDRWTDGLMGNTSLCSVTYYVEFLPKKIRGVCIVLLEVWWAVGSVFAALLALAVIPNGKSHEHHMTIT